MHFALASLSSRDAVQLPCARLASIFSPFHIGLVHSFSHTLHMSKQLPKHPILSVLYIFPHPNSAPHFLIFPAHITCQPYTLRRHFIFIASCLWPSAVLIPQFPMHKSRWYNQSSIKLITHAKSYTRGIKYHLQCTKCYDFLT